MAETNTNTPEMKKRDMVYSRMKAKYPDKTFDDDEAIFGQIEEDYNGYDNAMSERDNQLKEYRDREDELNKLFNRDPYSAKFISGLANGRDPRIMLIEDYGPEIIDIVNDPDKQEEVAEANKEFAKRLAKEKEYEDMYQANLQESFKLLDKLESEGRSAKQLDDAFQFLINIGRDVMTGKISAEVMDFALKAINHDEDVAMAASDGEVRGRNAQIDEKLRKRGAGDGVSRLSGKGTPSAPPSTKRDLGVLDKYGDNNPTIWEKGGEKRTRLK